MRSDMKIKNKWRRLVRSEFWTVYWAVLFAGLTVYALHLVGTSIGV
jgi:hypothetical protein